MFRNALDITRKDLQLLVRDRRAIAVLVILPLVFIAILGLSTSRLLGWKNDNITLNVGVVNRDSGPVSLDVVDALEARHGLKLICFANDTVARRELSRERLNALMVIGESFDARVGELSLKDILQPENGRLAPGLASLDVDIQTRATGSPVDSIVRHLLNTAVVRAAVPYVARRYPLTRRLVERSTPPKETPMTAQPAPSAARDGGGKANVVYLELVPSYTVMFVFFLVTIMGRSFIQECELGTLRRLRLTPARPLSIVIGKTLPFLVISLVQTGILFLFGRFLFGMPWGSRPLWLIPVSISTSLAATGLGLLFATLVRSDSQVSAYGNLIVLTMAGISGCLMPRDWLPDAMQQISLATPHAWSLMAYHELLHRPHPNFSRVASSMLVLIVFASAFLTLGWWRFRSVT